MGDHHKYTTPADQEHALNGYRNNNKGQYQGPVG
jgi:hypothetical protein